MNAPLRGLECPAFSDAPESLHRRYAQFVAAAEYSSSSAGPLVADLHQHAMNLGCSKAHEASPDIYWLLQSAAVVALLAFGSGSEIFRRQRAEVAYYGAFADTREQVRAFEDFVAQWAL